MTKLVFRDKIIKLDGVSLKNIGVSRSSKNVASAISGLNGKAVLDIGCGVGYMTIGALLSGAKSVVAIDICDTEKILRKNLRVNNIGQNRVVFYKSYLFERIPDDLKFDVIIANLPQHALPAKLESKKLEGKYGGYDGTDLVCRSLSEAFFYLNSGGRYFGSISELTNHRRTFLIADSLYDLKLKKTVVKKIKNDEMMPFLTEREILDHLKKLKGAKMIDFSGDGVNFPIEYKVHYCQFNKKCVD